MKKFLFYHLLPVVCYLLFFATPTFAHDFGPVPAGGCPAGHTSDVAGTCRHTGCTDPADNPSGTSLPGQQTDFTNLMSQIGTQSTCTDTVVTGGVTDFCVSGTQLEEQYCVVNSSFPSGRCFQTRSACPSGTTCDISRGACVPSGGSGTCTDPTDNPSGTSLPGQQTDFTNLMSQIGTQSTCNDSVVTNRTDYCSSTQLVEHYCVVNSAFPTGRCFETLGTCPSGRTCNNGACFVSSGTTCTSNQGCGSGQICGIGGTCISCTTPLQLLTICAAGINCGTGNLCSINNNCYSCSSGGGTGPGGGSSGPFGLGTITAPFGFNLPFISSGNEDVFVAGLVRNGIGAMILIAFVVALIWLILAGFKFILANGEPKEVSAAWSQIRYALIGLAVIMSAFAIIKLVETFFNVNIIGGGLRLPTRSAP